MKHKLPPTDVLDHPRDVPPPFRGETKQVMLLNGVYVDALSAFTIEKADHFKGQDVYEFTIYVADPKQQEKSEFVLVCPAAALAELQVMLRNTLDI